MKKSIITIIAAASMLAACYDNVKLNNDPEFQPTANDMIGFSTYSEKTTRAADANSVNLYDFYKTFDVYAWKNSGADEQNVFNHVPVEYFTTDTQGTYVYKTAPAKPSTEWGASWATSFKGWFYQEIRYWDKLATGYNFYAIAPYEPTPSPALAIANGDDNIKIGSASDTYKISTEKNLAGYPTITNDKKYFGFNKDYMLADKSETKYQLVSLNFHHILTKFNVMITLTDKYIGSQPFTIKELDIVGLEDEGYFVYGTNMTTNGWTTKSGSKYDIKLDKDFILKNVPESVEDKTEYSGYYWIQTLIFPQTLTCASPGALKEAPANKYLYIEYTIGTEIFKAYYDLAYVFDNTLIAGGTYNLEQGSEYTINIKVGPEPIVFEANASKWADDLIVDRDVE